MLNDFNGFLDRVMMDLYTAFDSIDLPESGQLGLPHWSSGLFFVLRIFFATS